MTGNNSNKSLLIVGAKVRVSRDSRLFNTEFEGKVGEVTRLRPECIADVISVLQAREQLAA